MRKPHQRPRQNHAPALVFGVRKAGLQRGVVGGDERLDEVEHRVPQPRLDRRALLVVDRVLARQIVDDRLEPRIELQQRLELRGGSLASAAGKIGEQFERLALDFEDVARGQARDPAPRKLRDCATDR